MVFDGLCRYMTYRKYFSEKKAETEVLNKITLKAKVFKQLMVHKLQMAFDRQTTKAVHTRMQQRRLLAWRELQLEAVEESEERQAALRLLV